MPQTVPNRPTKGLAEATLARNSRFGFEPFDFARDRHVEHLVDARVQAGERGGRGLKRALPLAHRRDEQARRAGIGPLRQRPVELLERLAGPENLLEALHRAPELGEQQRLVDDDGPAPERGREQAEHDDLDHDMRRPKHRQQRGFRVGGDGGRSVGGIHSGGDLVKAGRTAFSFEPGRRRSAPEMGRNLGLRDGSAALAEGMQAMTSAITTLTKPGFRPTSGGRPAPEPLVSGV